jgi:hypothetical protein
MVRGALNLVVADQIAMPVWHINRTLSTISCDTARGAVFYGNGNVYILGDGMSLVDRIRL